MLESSKHATKGMLEKDEEVDAENSGLRKKGVADRSKETWSEDKNGRREVDSSVSIGFNGIKRVRGRP